MQQDVDWVSEQLERHKSDSRAAVLLAQATPTVAHELFFKQLVESCKKWIKPVLYLHADGHVWQVEKAWRVPNLWRVQTDQVRLYPPVLVTVTEDPNNPFTCYAESKDGINWVKPKLGIIEWQGSNDNNIILSGDGTHNFTPFLDANPAFGQMDSFRFIRVKRRASL